MSIRASAILVAACLGCGRGAQPGPETNRVVVEEADGRYAFYGGQGIADILAHGDALPDEQPISFVRLRVPSAFVDAALASANRVKTVSFEVPDPSIEATVRKWMAGTTTRETLYFHPGDPWLSGYAQVAQGDDNYVMGLFEVIRWTKGAPGMPDLLAQDIFTTGLLPDEARPPLTYADDPATWPPIPNNWN